MNTVIGIGSAYIDYFFETSHAFLTSLGVRPEEDKFFDEKRLLDEIFSKLTPRAKSPGGSTINTLAVLGKLGAKASYQGVIGVDKESRYWKNNVKEIDISGVFEKGSMSICACLLTGNGRERTFISTTNAYDNDFFKLAKDTSFESFDMLHITQFFQNPEETFPKLAGLVKRVSGPKISFSPGVAYANLGVDTLLPIFKKTYVLFCNTQELTTLIHNAPPGASKKLLEYGPHIVVCTMGDRGALITTKDKQFYASAVKVSNIVDTTGAGDAFAAGFLYGLLEKKSLEESAFLGNKIAAKSLTDFGLNWLKTKNILR
ncbi:MAG TPA: PfkB family carbohydrate kinase [Candidatus Saccharimonadales bacterium]|nr:PfkB family carbohydrate kinase [Candidatus Saccharimonadales bacterium]